MKPAFPPWSTLLEDVEFVVFDLETTGLDGRSDRILTIGAVTIARERIVTTRSLHLHIAQEQPSNSRALAIHEILSSTGDISEKEALRVWDHYSQNCILVAHHLGFDLAFIKGTYQRHNIPWTKPYGIDLPQLESRLQHPTHLHPWHRQNESSLEVMAERYGIAISGRHDALSDALATAEIFLSLLQLCRRRKIDTLGKLIPLWKRWEWR